MSKVRSALYLLPLLIVAAAAGYMVSKLLAATAPQLASGTVLPGPRVLPPFKVADHDGNAFDNTSLAGRPALMFFGFTHCPDVCPETLVLMAQLQRDPALAKLRPVFVTVDPERDDAQALRLYVNAFGPGFTGLRGTQEQLEPLLRGLGVAHAVVPLPGGGYTVDHSAALYYLNGDGHWSAVFTPPFTLGSLRQDLATLLASGY